MKSWHVDSCLTHTAECYRHEQGYEESTEKVELSVFLHGLLQIDSSQPWMLKCSVVSSQSVLPGLLQSIMQQYSWVLCQSAVGRLLSDCYNKGQNETGSDVRYAKNRFFTFFTTAWSLMMRQEIQQTYYFMVHLKHVMGMYGSVLT